MIDLTKLLAKAEFHIKRGDNMLIDPKEIKSFAMWCLAIEGEFDSLVNPLTQTDRDFETEQVEAAEALNLDSSWPCEIVESDFEKGTILLKMCCDDYKVSSGQYWLSTSQQPAQNQQPFCYMSDDYEIGLFTKQPDNPAYADFFAVYKDPQPAPGVQELVDVLSLTRSTVVRQLQLIEERAKGKFLDKRPVVDALRAHVKRIDTALAKHGGNDE